MYHFVVSRFSIDFEKKTNLRAVKWEIDQQPFLQKICVGRERRKGLEKIVTSHYESLRKPEAPRAQL